jgi:AcrR family transcriptional regulator
MTTTLVKKPRATRDTQSRQRFLDAAEFLFAEHGYEGTKIRAIAERSKVNLGALHHYWGSKEELFTAVCERRLLPMNKECLNRFIELETQADGIPIDIRELFRASLEPTFFLSGLNEEEQVVFRKFYGRTLADPSFVVGKVMRKLFEPISTKFFAILRELCPHLTDDEFFWRSNCILGSYLFAPAFCERMIHFAPQDFAIDDVDLGITEIVEFLVAGIQAPSTKK